MEKIKPSNPPVPKQKKGVKSDTTHSVKFKTINESIAFFKVVKKRLLNVSEWHSLCGLGSATFALTDSSGSKVKRFARQGDLLRIDIIGPSTKNGEQFDWVKIELIENIIHSKADHEELSMRVSPVANPKNKTGKTAHFFKEDASSTFIVLREKNIVKAEIHGRNEVPNVDQDLKIDSIRNAFVALASMLGFSKFQWRKLVKGLVGTKNF